MRKTTFSIMMIVIVLAVGVAGFTVFAQEAYVATPMSQDDLHLTIYNDGLTLIQDVRTFEVVDGLNRLDFTNISPQLDMTSVALVSVSNPTGTYVVQQQYTPASSPPILNASTLLQENMGSVITAIKQDGEEVTGTLLAYGNEVVLQLESGQIQTIHINQIREYRFDNLPDMTQENTEPALQITVNSNGTGEQQFALTYLVQGLQWQATNYNLVVLDEAEALNITGWVSIYNGTGMEYADANITLATGDFNRLSYVGRETNAAYAATATPTGTPTPLPSPPAPPATVSSGFGQNIAPNIQPEGALFPLERRLTIPSNGTRLIEFLAGADAETREVFVYDASPRIFGYSGFITDPSYGLTNVTNVLNFLEFTTFEDDGLGTALPAGRMRIYQENSEGTPLLIGESNLGYTPENETVQIFLNNNDDLTGERRQTDYQALSGDVIQETYEIRLRNRLNKDVTVIVPERLSRSANWEIISATAPFEQPNSFGMEFEVDVEAGEEVSLTYTVLYTRTR